MSRVRKGMAIIVAVFAFAALTAFSGIAGANDCGWKGEGGHGHRHGGPDFCRIAAKLALTDAQKAQAKAIFQGNRESVKPILTNLRAERKNLRTLIHAETPDEAAIRAETAKIAGIEADLNVIRAKAGAQFRAILTPSQQAELKKLRDKGHGKGETSPAAAAE